MFTGPPQLTQEQTYRYVYYYYNYYAALETQDGDTSTGVSANAELYTDAVRSQQQQYMTMNQQSAWPNNTANRQGSGSHKRQMRGLFDEWRRKYEEWYITTFGKPVNVSTLRTSFVL